MRVFIVTLLIILAPLALLSQSTSAEDAHQVYMFFEEQIYGLGDTVEINATVLTNSEYSDPVEIYVNIDQLDESHRRINMTRMSVGRFNANFTVQLGDVSDYGTVSFAVVAKFDDDTYENDRAGFHTKLTETLSANIVLTDPNDDVVEFGDDIEFTVKVQFMGEPVDPDEGSLIIGGYEAIRPSYLVGSLVNVSRIAKGLYNGTFTIPGDRNESAHFLLIPDATYTVDNRTWAVGGSTYYERDLYVNLFDVWAQIDDVTRESAGLVLHVTDLGGTPAEGAVVNFNLTYRDTEDDTIHIPMSGTVGAEGHADFILTYEDLYNRSDWVEIRDGIVMMDGLVQHFDGRVNVPEWNGTSPITSSSYTTIEVESPVQPRMVIPVGIRFVEEYEPEVGRQIYVTVRTDSEVLYTIEMATGADGWANFSFTAPDLESGDGTSLSVTREWSYWCETGWGEIWLNTRSTRIIVGEEPVERFHTPWLDPETTLEADEFPPYGPIDIRMDNPDADGDAEIAILLWAVGKIDGYVEQGLYPGFQKWSAGSGFMGRSFIRPINQVQATWNGEAYTASVYLPSYLPDDIEIFMYGGIEFIDSPVQDIRSALLEGLVAILPHARPEVTVDVPEEHGWYKLTLNASGTASSVTNLEQVEIRLDLGPWIVANGTEVWSLSLDLSDLVGEDHILSVRAFDGTQYSDTVEVTFTVEEEDPSPRPTSMKWWYILIVIAIVLGTIVVVRSRPQRSS